MIPSSRCMLRRDKRLPLDTWNQSDYRKTLLEINLLRSIHPEIILKEFNLKSLKPEGRRLFTQVKTDIIKAQFQCRHLQQDR